MKDKSIVIKLADLLLFTTMIGLISLFDNLLATFFLSFCIVSCIILVHGWLEYRLLHQENKLATVIEEIRKMDKRKEKVVNILTLFFPSVFFALLISGVYLLLRVFRK